MQRHSYKDTLISFVTECCNLQKIMINILTTSIASTNNKISHHYSAIGDTKIGKKIYYINT